MQIFAAEEKVARRELSQLTTDGFDNFVSKLGLNNNNALSAGTYEFNLVTRNRIKLEAAYRGSWVVGQVVDVVAEDMTRAGVNVTTSESDGAIPKKLQKAMIRLQIWNSLQLLIKWGRLYGGAIAVIQIDGQKMDTPLNLDRVGKGQFKGLVVFDRWQLNPDLFNLIKSGPNLGLPEYYDIVNNPAQLSPDAKTATGEIKVHHSRCIRYIGIDLPYFQAITEMMWGESVLERLWDRLISFDDATMNAANLVGRANLRTVGIDGLREILAAGGQAQAGLEAQFEMMRLLQVNEGLTLIDKNDTFATTSYTFAGLSDMMLQFGQQLSGASNIPLLRLFSQSPAGLNADGESDIRMYYDSINAQQKSKLTNPFEVVLKVMYRSEFGDAPPDDLDFNFVPLWQMDETDKANNGKTNAETIIGAYESGLTNRECSLKELKQTSSNTGLFSNITDEDIKEAANMADEPPLPDGDPNAADPAKEPSDKPVKSLDAKPSVVKRLKKWWSL